MRSKLQIAWDLAFISCINLSFYRHICILTKVYLLSLAITISAIYKNSISHQMGVVDGRSYRVTRLVTCKKDVYLRFLAPRAFI